MIAWACYQTSWNGKVFIQLSSVSWTRKDSIKNLLEGSSTDWKTAKKQGGWNVGKISITINP